MLRTAALATIVALLCPASAQGQDDIPSDGTVQSAWEALERLPPSVSWDVAMQVGYGDITYFRVQTPPWLGMGLRTAYGTHFGRDNSRRIAGLLTLSFEGPVPQYFTTAIEPALAWDQVRGGLQIGVSAGPTLLLHHALDSPVVPAVTPSLAARVGYSEPFSRVSRRLFVLAEPKLRWVAGRPNWSVAVVVGSGRGR